VGLDDLLPPAEFSELANDGLLPPAGFSGLVNDGLLQPAGFSGLVNDGLVPFTGFSGLVNDPLLQLQSTAATAGRCSAAGTIGTEHLPLLFNFLMNEAAKSALLACKTVGLSEAKGMLFEIHTYAGASDAVGASL